MTSSTLLITLLFVMHCQEEPEEIIETPTGPDLTAPIAPQGFAAVAGDTWVDLIWTTNKESDLHGYIIYRHKELISFLADSLGFVGAADSTYRDTNVLKEVPYYYWVAAADTAGNVGTGSLATITLEDSEAPQIPTGLVALTGFGQVSLYWNHVTNPDLFYYTIYRNTADDPSGADSIGHLHAPATTFTDRKVTNGVTYHYWITATDQYINESEKSTMLTGTPRESLVFKKTGLLYEDDFEDSVAQWLTQQRPGGTTILEEGTLEIDDIDGCTIWLTESLEGNVSIEYDILMIDAGGPNDRVSDLNCFWMATDPQSEDGILTTPRTGLFADYHCLQLYYVGYGGNNNETTRFRRYPGNCNRPILPTHDLSDTKYLNQANVWRHVQIVSFDGINLFKIDGEIIFQFIDEAPFTEGWFGFRTVGNHMKIDHFRVYRLE